MISEDLPVVEFGFPGPLRDQLVAAIVAGSKTTTSGLVADYERAGEPLPLCVPRIPSTALTSRVALAVVRP